MGNAVRKFMPRAFRYVLRPQDNQQMRFSLEHARGAAAAENTILINMSETGVAFLVSPDQHIRINEKIKVEIPVPGGQQVAWWGRVVRIEEYEGRGWMFGPDPFRDERKLLIGVRFEGMPEGHMRSLRKGIEQSFMKAMRDQQYRNWLYYRAYVLQNIWRFSILAGLTLLAFAFLYAISRPSSNYDAERGAPWGERYKFWR